MFSFFKPKAKEVSTKKSPKSNNRDICEDYRTIQKQLAEQDVLLQTVQDAEKCFESDKDELKLIDAYEKAFFSDCPLRSSSRARKLLKLYLKRKDNNKAWGFLNYCIGKQLLPIEQIRRQQADILKSEKKYEAAVENYLLSTLAEIKDITCEPDAVFNDFKARIKTCAKALKWEDDEVEYCVYLLSNHWKKKNFDESIMIKSYRAFIESRKSK